MIERPSYQTSRNVPLKALPVYVACERTSRLSLDHHRYRVSPAEAERRDAALGVLGPHGVYERRQNPCATGANRMAEGDRTAVDIELLLRDVQLAHHGNRRGRERFVVLEQV